MTCRTETRRSADRARGSGAATEPICRRLLDIEQAIEGAAEVCDEPLEWICDAAITGKLPVYHLAGGPRIDEVELARALAARRAEWR
jgi:hypothetical protein